MFAIHFHCYNIYTLQHSQISGVTVPHTASTSSPVNSSSNVSNSSQAPSKPKKKQWRTLKQITAAEQLLPWPSTDEKTGKVLSNDY